MKAQVFRTRCMGILGCHAAKQIEFNHDYGRVVSQETPFQQDASRDLDNIVGKVTRAGCVAIRTDEKRASTIEITKSVRCHELTH